MTLLKTQEFIDLVDLNHFLTEHYGYPKLGSADSFHRTFSDAMGEPPGNGEMAFVEFGDDPLEWYEENYSTDYAKVVEAFRRLIADGHLPAREEFNVYVWW